MIYYNEVIKNLSIKLYRKIDIIFTQILRKYNIDCGFNFDENKFMSVWFLYDVANYPERKFNMTGALWRIHNTPNIKYKPLKKSYEFYNYG